MNNKELDIKCPICGRTPENISEYVNGGYELDITPRRYVMEEEGTYNTQNGHFYCTSCYIKLGMPLGVAK